MKIIEPTPPTRSDFFSAVWQGQTWLNLLYLLLSFPLGIIYFVLIITGLSLGLGLLITIIGIFILMAVIAMIHYLARFEIGLTNALLGFQLIHKERSLPEPGFWNRFRSLLRSGLTWKGLIYLFVKFPLGILNFSLMISLLAASLGLISVPILYRYPWFEFDWPNHYFWMIDTLPGALIVGLVGLILLFVSLFLLNLLAWANGIFAKALLSDL